MTAHLPSLAKRGVLVALLFALGTARGETPAPFALETFRQSVVALEKTVPTGLAQWTTAHVQRVDEQATKLESAAAELATYREVTDFSEAFAVLRALLDAKTNVDRLLAQTLERRAELRSSGADKSGRDRLRAFLAISSRLIDLSGRLRYQLIDAIAALRSQYLRSPDERAKLVEELRGLPVGATALVDDLFDTTAQPDLRSALLQGIAEARQSDVLADLAEFIAQPDLPAELVLEAAQTILAVGLPQTPRPDTPPNLPPPAITAQQLLDRIAAVTPSAEHRQAQQDLIEKLKKHASAGLDQPRLRIGSVEIEPGDWLLMRNPSPYNLFTDLSPGLFTHVGVVTLEQGSDGIKRMVILDLTEKGRSMPVTTADAFLKRSLHYVFLRPKDPAVAQAMADAARSMIGNEIEFDMTFRTDRILPLKKTPLAGKKIHTYCAGLLLLCALQTDVAIEKFFPIREFPAPGHTADNLAKLGMSIGADFVSPTGALFSSEMQLVGGREPMYDPRREVEETIFDHFAAQMRQATLSPRPGLYDDLRLRLAEASKTNPLLAQALTQAVDVNVDLVAGAKAAAVIDTLDEITFGSSAEFLDARDSLRAGPIAALRAEGFNDQEIALVERYRTRHAELSQKLEQGQLTPRELRIALVKYYSEIGKKQLDERFFQAAETGQ